MFPFASILAFGGVAVMILLAVVAIGVACYPIDDFYKRADYDD